MSSRIDHIGVVVGDLYGAVEFLRGAFGLTVDREVEEPTFGLHARFLRWGDVSIELIEFDDPRTRQERLGGDPAKLDHIAVEVASIDTEIESLRSQGFHTATKEPIVIGGRRTMFLDPRSSEGVRYQLLEAEPR